MWPIGVVEACASQPHYAQHLFPIWAALPPERRGHLYLLDRRGLHEALIHQGWRPEELREGRPPSTAGPLLVAAAADLWACAGRPVIFVDHGAGQTYSGPVQVEECPSYNGGRGRDAVRLFLCVNERTAAMNQARYPNAAVAVIGDPTIQPVARTTEEPWVAFSFHSDLSVTWETRTGWTHWKDAVLEFAKNYPYVLGHAHPRAKWLGPWWQDHGIEFTPYFDEVKARAAVFCVDNSSTLYEFAALDRPVVVLDAPFYRRNVTHGLRFWEFADIGVRISELQELPDAISEALRDPPHVQARRRGMVRQIYAATGVESVQKATAAIIETFAL